MIRRRKLIWTSVIALLAGYSSAQVTQPGWQSIEVGVNFDYPPYEYVGRAGTATGFNVDIVQAAAQAVYLKAQIRPGKWADIRQKVEAGEMDLLAGMLFSEERAMKVEFGAPYLLVEYSVFVRDGNEDIRDVTGLRDYRILVEEGSQMHDQCRRLGFKNIIPVASEPEALQQLIKGRGDAALLPLLEGLLLLRESPNDSIKPVTGISFSRNLCFAATKGDRDLIGKLNTGLAIIKSNGEYDRIYDKWFGAVTPRPSRPSALTLWLTAGTAIALAASVTWVVTLRRQVSERTKLLKNELTERARIESELRTRENLYRTLLEQAAEGIFLADKDLVLIDVNEAGCKMCGYEREELLGMSVSTLFHTSDLERLPIEAERLLAGELVSNERLAIRKDGTSFYVESTAKRIGPDLFQGIVRDITDRKNQETALRRTNEELEVRVEERTKELADAYRELEGFSYSVAHDLRAPLRAMDGYASILLLEHSYELSDEAKAHLKRISANARRMGLLIDTLLGYARMGRSPLKPTKLDISKIAHNEWSDLSTNLNGREVEFSVGKIPAMKGDETLLKLLLHNLLSNSIKFTKGVHPAKIEVGYESSTKSVFVRDNGVGFDQRYAGKLFRVFERLHTDDFEGTGVGLATVKRIVDKHGGSVSAEGAINGGATFRFTLG